MVIEEGVFEVFFTGGKGSVSDDLSRVATQGEVFSGMVGHIILLDYLLIVKRARLFLKRKEGQMY